MVIKNRLKAAAASRSAPVTQSHNKEEIKAKPYIWGSVERVGVHHHRRSVSLEIIKKKKTAREDVLLRNGGRSSRRNSDYT